MFFIRIFTVLSFFISFFYASADKTVTLAYFKSSIKDVSAKDSKISLEIWVRELGKKIGLKVEPVYYGKIEEFKRDFENKKIDLAIASPLTFIKDMNTSLLTDGFYGGGKDTMQMCIVAKNDPKIKSLKDLRNKRIAVLTNDDIAVLYLDEFLLRNFHKSTKNYFKKIIEVKKRSQGILKIFFDKADAAIVTKGAYLTAVELNPQIKKRVKILKEYNLNLSSPAYFRKDLDKNTIEKVKKAVFNLNTYPKGKQILTIFKISKMVPCSVTKLKEMKKIYESYLKLKRKYEGE